MAIVDGSEVAEILPKVSPNQMAGLLEAVAADPYHGKADLPQLTNALQIDTGELFQIIESL
ncbi:nitrate ABC transporter ATP-binding protein, partial [bacterium]|nr:nitrate ABC transporter ATP-binding protein [bacterium]